MENTSGLKLLESGYEGVALTKIFPAKSFYNSAAGGAWYTAKVLNDQNRLEKQKKDQNEIRTFSSLKKQRIRDAKKKRLYEKGQDVPEETESQLDERANHLDGFYLLRTHGVADPGNLSAVDISGRPLETANDEDLELFENVIYVNASETLLPFETYNGFPSLKELEAPLCALRSLRVNMNDFACLELLDLSYNNLKGEDVAALSILPKLKALYLTGNQLTHLPTSICSNVVFKSASGSVEVEAFPNLEVLHLDDNSFEDPNTLAVLAALPQLKSLCFDKNNIPAIPYIKVSSRQKPIEREHVNATEFDVEEAEEEKDEFGLQDDMNLDDLVKDSQEAAVQGKNENSETNKDEHPDQQPSSAVNEVEEDSKEVKVIVPQNSVVIQENGVQNEQQEQEPIKSPVNNYPTHPPFPELRLFSIAYNKISSEDGVLPVVGWPMLQEINITGNPIVTKHKGEPPLLNRYLTNRLGISLKRFDSPVQNRKDQDITARPTALPPTNRRIPEVIPPIKKRPIDFMAIEYPGVFDPLPSRGDTFDLSKEREHAQNAFEDQLVSPHGSSTAAPISPEVRPMSASQHPLPPIGQDLNQSQSTQSRPKSGPEDLHHLRLAPVEMNRLMTEDLLKTSSKSSSERKSQSQSGRDDNGSNEEQDSDNDDRSSPFFLTQANEDGEKELVDMTEQPVDKSQLKTKKYIKEVPKRLKPFQMLYEIDEDEEKYSINLPKDVQSNVKALKYALKHPIVLGDAKGGGGASSLYNHSSIDYLHQPDKYKRMSKPKKVKQSKADMFYDTLADLKNRVAFVETNLETALAQSNVKQLKQVESLVNEIQDKYKQSSKDSSKKTTPP